MGERKNFGFSRPHFGQFCGREKAKSVLSPISAVLAYFGVAFSLKSGREKEKYVLSPISPVFRKKQAGKEPIVDVRLAFCHSTPILRSSVSNHFTSESPV